MADAPANPFLHHVRHLIGNAPGMAMTDGQLLERFLADRDETAVEILVRRYGPLVFGVCRRVLHDRHAAEDAFQATFLVLMRKAPALDRAKPLGSWLYTVAYRLALRARANEARRRESEAQAAQSRPEALNDAVSTNDLVIVLEEELHRLPEKFRVPLVLCYLEGKTNEQAARVLGCPRGSMSAQLAQARDRLREHLARRGFAGTSASVAGLLTTGAASASVPLPLLHNTVRAAVWFTAGESAGAGFVSTEALSLAKGAVKTMLVHKLKIAAGLLLAASMLGTGATMLLLAAGHTPNTAEPRSTAPAPERAEALPAGAVARLGTTQLRHGDAIFFAACMPDGKALLTASKDRTVRLWDLATGKEIRRFDLGEAKPADDAEASKSGSRDAQERRLMAALGWDTQAALSPDGKLVAAARGGTTILWETATGKKLHELKAGKSGLGQLTFSADSKSLFTLDFDLSAAVWDVASGACVKRAGPKQAAGKKSDGLGALSPGFKYLAWQHIELATASFNLKVMDLATGKELPDIKAPLGGPQGMTFLDDKTLAWSTIQGGIVLWDVPANKELHRLGDGDGYDPVTGMAYATDGKALAVSRSSGTAELWDPKSGKRLFRTGAAPAEQGGLMILVAGLGAMGRQALTFSPDGKTLLASLGGATIHRLDTTSGTEMGGQAGGHRAPVSHLALSADGRSLMTYGHGDPLHWWDLARMAPLRQVSLPGKPTSTAFSAAGQTFATAAGKAVTLHDADGKELRKITTAQPPVAALALSPDGALLATRSGFDPTIHLWDTKTGEPRATLGQAGDAPQGNGIVLAETAGVVPPDVVFSPDGRSLAGAGPKRQLCVWDVASGNLLWEVAPSAGQAIERFAFSGNSRCLATLNADGTVILYETATGEKRGRLGEPNKKAGTGSMSFSFGAMNFSLVEQRDAPICLAFAPGGRYLAVAKDTPDIHLWDLITGREVGKLKGHEGGVVSLLFTPDGKRLVSGGKDTTALTWDVTGLLRQESAGVHLDAGDLDALWADLAGKDAAKAFAAIRKLGTSPQQAVNLIKERVHPVSSPDGARVAQLLGDLESDRFEVRRKAESELERLGQVVEPELRKVLADEPSVDLRQRVDRLLQKLTGQAAASLVRDLRAVELLELVGGSEARQVLQTLAGGAAGARLTREAKAAAERLAP
jgi:RNA polymerase sigma factor (sigma-70 family)